MVNLLAEAICWPLEIAKIIAPVVLVLLGLWVWHYQKRREPHYQSLAYITQKRVDGLLAAWSLLAYMTETENPNAVVIWKKNAKETIYYLRPAQARDYMASLSSLFYGSGYGLLLDGDIKELLYEYRSQIYGVLLKADCLKCGDEPIKLENVHLVNQVKELYAELNAQLRKELAKIEK